jgi:hypothetical protein
VSRGREAGRLLKEVIADRSSQGPGTLLHLLVLLLLGLLVAHSLVIMRAAWLIIPSSIIVAITRSLHVHNFRVGSQKEGRRLSNMLASAAKIMDA